LNIKIKKKPCSLVGVVVEANRGRSRPVALLPVSLKAPDPKGGTLGRRLGVRETLNGDIGDVLRFYKIENN
jgi:hypothetical protein